MKQGKHENSPVSSKQLHAIGEFKRLFSISRLFRGPYAICRTTAKFAIGEAARELERAGIAENSLHPIPLLANFAIVRQQNRQLRRLHDHSHTCFDVTLGRTKTVMSDYANNVLVPVLQRTAHYS